jgi:hypothetical protein
MKREQLWSDIADKADALEEANEDWRLEDTPVKRLKLESALREYIGCLGPIIGHEAAFRYEASWQAFQDASDRQAQLVDTMATQPTFDQDDADLLHRALEEQDVAMKAFDRSLAALLRALEEARQRDDPNGEMR